MSTQPSTEPATPSGFRLLILAPASDLSSKPPFISLLGALTGSKPSAEIASFSGYTSHPPLALRTKYYGSDVSIWCDELPAIEARPVRDEKLEHPGAVEDERSAEPRKRESSKPPSSDDAQDESDGTPIQIATLSEWKDQMLSAAAAEVRAVIGGIVLILPVASFSSPAIHDSFISLIETVHVLREAIEEESYGRDIASIVVFQSTLTTVSLKELDGVKEKAEEVCLSERGILGWDFVAWDGGLRGEEGEEDVRNERNEYGEKTGIPRVVEVLEGIDWSRSPNLEEGDDAEFELGELDADEELASSASILRSGRFSGLDYELQREMMELKLSMLEAGEEEEDSAPGTQRKRTGEEDEDFQVDQLPGLMERVVAIREAGSEMPKAERERFARREIEKIMREMG